MSGIRTTICIMVVTAFFVYTRRHWMLRNRLHPLQQF